MQNEGDHCLLLALPCGRDAGDVRNQTHILKTSLISYLLQKQAAGIINVQSPQQLQGAQVCWCVCLVYEFVLYHFIIFLLNRIVFYVYMMLRCKV